MQHLLKAERQRVEQEYALKFSIWQQEALNKTSSRAVSAARSTIKGQVAEQLIPLLKTCPYAPSDMRFFGMPIDYIIFEGMTEARDGEGADITVVFMDVKTGNASLSPIQRLIKSAVEQGRVRWETYRL
jgi:predicted Holliday junction resolvase-like endonuclease